MLSPHPTPLRRAALAALFLLIASGAAGAQPAPAPLYRNATQPVAARVADLLARMTLEEKVAQLQARRLTDPQAFDATGAFVGTVDVPMLTAGPGAVWADTTLALPDIRLQVRRTNALQRYVIEHTRLGIPLLPMAESLHGFMAQGATSFPQAIALGCTWDPALAEKVFTVAAREAAARGYRQVLSPVLDLAREPRWGRYEECYSEDPVLAARMAVAAVSGLQGTGPLIDAQHVGATLKHFAGHGQPEGGRNVAPIKMTERELRAHHLYPFEMAVKQAHARAVMASYNEWDGVPNHMSRWLLTDLLRGEWGFGGCVISDDRGIANAAEDHLAAADAADAGRLCLAAGLDFNLGAGDPGFARLAEQVRTGAVAAADLDRAVAGMLRLKFECGLFESPYADPDEAARVTNTPEAKALARQAAREAMVLLKNEGRLLPLDTTKIRTLAVIGPNAAGIHLGGYSPVPMAGISVLDGLREAVGDKVRIAYAEGCRLTANKASGWLANEPPQPVDAAENARLTAEAVAAARTADVVVLVLGESELLRREAWSEEHLGDRDTLALTGRQEELARAVLATGKPVVALLINGGPLAVNSLQATAPAILECWYLGQETGRAVADILFGKASPSGKLSVTLPRSVGQLPCYYDHQPSRFRHYTQADSTPLYPFGFGLTYTTFAYRKLQVTPAAVPAGGTAHVSVEVTNTGAVAADEIVQLYVHARVSLPIRPVLELKDFARVTLAPGESRTVSFELTPDKLAAWDSAMRRTVQPGDFEIKVGPSSADLLTQVLRVE